MIISDDFSVDKELFCDTILPFFLNLRFFKRKIFVRFSDSLEVVSKYSQERIAKNKAKIKRCVTALSQWLYDILNILRRTDVGIAFCFFFPILSRFL